MFDGDLLSERARTTPDRVALVSVETGERLTYAALNARAERAADALRALGLQPGDRFGLLSYNCIEFLEVFFGAGKTGAIVVPLSTRATAHELDQIARDCGMRVLFHGDEFRELASELPVESAHRISWRPADPVRPAKAHSDNPEDICCLLYTSGTTGKPKGVMVSRRMLYWNGYNTVVNWGLREDDVSPIFTPLYHAGGLGAFLIPIFLAGGRIVLHKGFDAAEVWRTIESERCTVVLGVPTIWKMLMDDPQMARTDLNHVRWFISGGAPLPQYITTFYMNQGITFRQGYGMTEVGVNCFTMTSEDARRKQGSIGKPMMFTSVRLVDAEGHDVPTGEIGEMWFRGPHLSSGYWNNEAATREAYGEDGWFHTGDLARCDEEGFFTIAGRRKEMFISGGVNVYPAEIEAELVSHPDVSDAAVVAVGDPTWGEVGVAFVVCRGVTPEDLASYLMLRIAKYKVPKRFVLLDVLPRTAYGKVVKADLLSMLKDEG